MIQKTIFMRDSLDPDHDQHFVGPDLGLNCLPRLSADVKSLHLSKERVKEA